MTHVRLKRVSSTDEGTFGVLVINDRPFCVTCEDPWKGNAASMSCIPIGTYKCEKWNGTKYRDVWELRDVPGRSYILIHQGNTIKDTQGCILIGKSFGDIDGVPAILESVATLEKLRKILPDNFEIEID